MPPTAVAAFVKKWFRGAGRPHHDDPQLVRMRTAQYRRMIADWQSTLEEHLPSAAEQGEEALNAILYSLNITLQVGRRQGTDRSERGQ